jgi:hypothetical protein
MSEEQDDSYGDVKAAFEEAAASDGAGEVIEGTAEVVEEPTEEAASEEQPKEEQAAEEESAAEGAAVTEEAAVEEPPSEWSQDKAPQSWSHAAREQWADLPESIRKEVVRREEAAVQGIRQLHEKIAPAEGFLQSMEPYFQEAKSAGVVPQEYIGGVMRSERILRTAEMPAKLNEVVRIAEQYGVPLRQIINQSVGEEMIKAPQQEQPAQLPPEVQQELSDMRQWRESQARDSASNEVNSFGKDKPYFDQVRGVMANLIESGVATDLEGAYEQAIWADPTVRGQMLQDQEAKRKEQLDEKARQTAASTSIPDSGTVDVPLGDDGGDDVADIVRNAFYKQSSGRM